VLFSNLQRTRGSSPPSPLRHECTVLSSPRSSTVYTRFTLPELPECIALHPIDSWCFSTLHSIVVFRVEQLLQHINMSVFRTHTYSYCNITPLSSLLPRPACVLDTAQVLPPGLSDSSPILSQGAFSFQRSAKT